MLKKLTAMGVTGALLLSMTIPVMANCYGRTCFSSTTENEAKVTTETYAISNTGGNSQSNIASISDSHEAIALSASGYGTRTLSTGAAVADARSITVVNASNCGCTQSRCLTSRVENEDRVDTSTGAEAGTGNNFQDNMTTVDKSHEVAAGSISLGGTSSLTTGPSTSRARNLTLVNVRWSR